MTYLLTFLFSEMIAWCDPVEPSFQVWCDPVEEIFQAWVSSLSARAVAPGALATPPVRFPTPKWDQIEMSFVTWIKVIINHASTWDSSIKSFYLNHNIYDLMLTFQFDLTLCSKGMGQR